MEGELGHSDKLGRCPAAHLYEFLESVSGLGVRFPNFLEMDNFILSVLTRALV